MAKNQTPQERFDKANKDINKAMKKRKKLRNRTFRTKEENDEIERLTSTIAQKIEEKEFAKKQIENPPKVPQYNDTSRTINFAPTLKVKSDNTENKELHGHYHAGNKNDKKKSKVRMIFSLIGILCLVIVTAVVSVKITNCVNDSKNNSAIVLHTTVI